MPWINGIAQRRSMVSFLIQTSLRLYGEYNTSLALLEHHINLLLQYNYQIYNY